MRQTPPQIVKPNEYILPTVAIDLFLLCLLKTNYSPKISTREVTFCDLKIGRCPIICPTRINAKSN
jgi:hypothetical protein